MNMNLENPQTLQFTAECIKEAYRLTEQEIHNICTGVVNYVPYGFWDYSIFFLGIGIMGGFLMALLKVIFD
jgi:hypothetical protein